MHKSVSRYKRIIWLRVSTNHPKWLSTGQNEPAGSLYFYRKEGNYMDTKKALKNELDPKEKAAEQLSDREENQEKDAVERDQAWWEAAMFLDTARDSDR